MCSYLSLYKRGTLEKVRAELLKKLRNCDLCPRRCRVNRVEGEIGFCKTGRLAKVNSFFLHFGEEPELIGRGGSGTIFFSWCNLGCIYCQNYTLSHLGEGRVVTPQDLAGIMVSLQKKGAENINFVTPTHTIAQIVEALPLAIEQGLRLPLVYNCGGYESVETLRLLEGIFDIYMPDVKYSDNMVAERFSSTSDYWEIVKETLKEMHRQVGDLEIRDSVAKKGLLIRHLVLPNHLAGSFKVLDFIKEEISLYTYVNIMQQYYPCYKAYEFRELSRRITLDEYRQVTEYAKKIGLHRGF